MNHNIKLTEYSHGAGCGCKISRKALDVILQGNVSFADARLLVGNSSRDDAAVYELGDGQAVISTTDFFMPIVDDPVDFGRIAATNAISDVYAMGGTPIMAIAILGWPIGRLSAKIAQQVVEGGRHACREAGISIAGVTAMTDVTGFGLLGHLSEMCAGSGLHARIEFDRVTQLEATEEYRQLGCIPGGTERNFDSYGARVGAMTEAQMQILCDPQTSGGLLVAVAPEAEADVLTLARSSGRSLARIGELTDSSGDALVEIVSAAGPT